MLFLFKYNLCLETLFPFILSAVPNRFVRQNACFRDISPQMFLWSYNSF